MTEPSYTQQDLQKVAADARVPYARTHEANLAKLAQLIKDADLLIAENEAPDYWRGLRNGLRRAVSVLEGKG